MRKKDNVVRIFIYNDKYDMELEVTSKCPIIWEEVVQFIKEKL